MFKEETMLFLKIISAIHKQNKISDSKKNLMLSEWTKGVKEGNTGTICRLLDEIRALNTNNVWDSELAVARERYQEVKGKR